MNMENEYKYLTKKIRSREAGYKELARAIIVQAKKDLADKGCWGGLPTVKECHSAFHFLYDKRNRLREWCEALLEG